MLNESVLSKDCLYLVALSGGADSVALLLMMREAGYRTEAVHCNFHLRGAESDRDEAFVVALCENLGVVLHRVHFDTESYARLHKLSIETAARELRYGYFDRLRHDVGAEAVAVAHHLDDQAETVLMNLVRGTGIRGLGGMRPRNGHIVRPLLDVSRQEIEHWLSLRHQPYVTDSTNLGDEAMRNRFRHHVIPLLLSLNPSAVENISRMAAHMQSVESIYEGAVEEARRRVTTVSGDRLSIDIARLKAERGWSVLLYEIVRPYGFSPSQCEQLSSLADAPSGRLLASATHQLVVDRRCLLLVPLAEPLRPCRIPEPGIYCLSDGRRLSVRLVDVDASFAVSRVRDAATLDASSVRFPLTLRPVSPGDRFVPYGMTGSKLVSDYLTDRRIPLPDKRSQLVLEDASDRIVWLVNERTDNRFRIRPASLKALVIGWS